MAKPAPSCRDRGTSPRVGRLLALVVVLAHLSLPAVSHAQRTWSHAGVELGLCHASIGALQALSDGDMAIGTPGGLNVWRGNRLAMASQGNGLPEGRVMAIAETADALWVGTWGGGVGILIDQEWRQLTGPSSIQEPQWVTALAAQGDEVWVATYGAGLVHISPGSWAQYRRTSDGLPSDYVTCLAPDGLGGLWVGTETQGLAYLSAHGDWTRLTLPESLGAHVTALAFRVQELWVGTTRGLGVLRPDLGRWTAANEFAEAPVTALAPRAGAGVWIGTWQGVFVAESTLGRLERYDREMPRVPVGALGVDHSGRLWVGTLGHGLYVEGDIAFSAPARYPVVLVHGWRGPDSDKLEDSEFWFLARWLRKDGFRPVYATGVSPGNTLYENAQRIGDTVREAAGDGRTYLIAFSMGGLNSRAYLESSLSEGAVARAFILGTPHRGEHLWLTPLLWERLAWRREPSAIELLPLHAKLFNETHAPQPSVPYTLIAGDARGAELPTLFRELPASDGLVSTWSALGPDAPTSSWDDAERRVTDDIHAWSRDTLALDVPSLLLPRSSYDAYIRPHLFGVADDPLLGTKAEMEATAPISVEPRSGLRVGSLAAGETRLLVPLPMGRESRARVYLRWQGPEPEYALIDPSGTRHTSKGTPSDSVEHLALDWASFASFCLTDTLAGGWTLDLSRSDDAAARTRFVAYATHSAPRLTIATDKAWYRPGEPIVIDVVVDNLGPGWATRDARVSLYSFAGDVRQVPTDPLVGRATWRARILAPNQSGYYALLGTSRGSSPEGRWERGAEALLGVMGTGARIVGTPAVQHDKENSSATVDLDVVAAGPYLVSVRGRSAGKSFLSPAHIVELAQGRRQVVVPMESPRYQSDTTEVEEVKLLSVSGPAILVDRWTAQPPPDPSASGAP